MKTTHEQIQIMVRGQSISVDQGVRRLIELMNGLPGVETYHSCQGDPDEAGYVHFGGMGALALLPKIAAAILAQERVWKRNHRHVCRSCRGMSVALEVRGIGICLRWATWDYARLLRVMRKLAQECANESKLIPPLSSKKC
jgi:hypothetical protein